MLVSTIAHQHGVEETFMDQGERIIGTGSTLGQAGGSPPQRGRLELIEPPTPS
jgi:hypothetical protein